MRLFVIFQFVKNLTTGLVYSINIKFHNFTKHVNELFMNLGTHHHLEERYVWISTSRY
jgi:hypothetical protein